MHIRGDNLQFVVFDNLCLWTWIPCSVHFRGYSDSQNINIKRLRSNFWKRRISSYIGWKLQSDKWCVSVYLKLDTNVYASLTTYTKLKSHGELCVGDGRLLEGGGCLLPKYSDNGMMKIWYRSLIVGIWQPARLVIQIILVIKYLILSTIGAVRHLRTTTLYMQV